MPIYIPIEKISNILADLNWLPGTLLTLTTSHAFWKRDPKPAMVNSITDANENVHFEFLAGQNHTHVIDVNKPFMFLGLIPIEFSTKKGYKAQRKQYPVLQFLDGDKIVFWDFQVLDGSTDDILVLLKNHFVLAKSKSHGQASKKS